MTKIKPKPLAWKHAGWTIEAVEAPNGWRPPPFVWDAIREFVKERIRAALNSGETDSTPELIVGPQLAASVNEGLQGDDSALTARSGRNLVESCLGSRRLGVASSTWQPLVAWAVARGHFDPEKDGLERSGVTVMDARKMRRVQLANALDRLTAPLTNADAEAVERVVMAHVFDSGMRVRWADFFEAMEHFGPGRSPGAGDVAPNVLAVLVAKRPKAMDERRWRLALAGADRFDRKLYEDYAKDRKGR